MIPLVIGHPRTGTSMMMAALRAGGMTLGYSATRERLNSKEGAYRANPAGLFECELAEVKTAGWPRQYDGKAVKAVLQWLGCVSVHDYQVVFMTRDPEEIRQSFEAAFHMKTTIERIGIVEEEAKRTIENRRDVRSVCFLRYEDVVADPRAAFARLNWDINVDAAAAVVDEQHHRFRIDKLTRDL